jgi:hypothetical protein
VNDLYAGEIFAGGSAVLLAPGSTSWLQFCKIVQLQTQIRTKAIDVK